MSITLACQTLAVSQLDSVIIAPPGPVEGENQTLAHLQPAWEQLEALVRSQQIAAIGTSDLDKDLLEQLYNWAQVSEQCDARGGCIRQSLLVCSSRLPKVMFHSCPVGEQVKPSSNQVNLASCCVMPPDLTAFAKEFDIQLLTHSDAKGDASFPFSKSLPNAPNWSELCRCFFLKYLFPFLSLSTEQTIVTKLHKLCNLFWANINLVYCQMDCIH